MKITPTYAPIADPESTAAEPLWGHYATMLTDGGDWGGAPGRRPAGWRRRFAYPDLAEPEPEVSNPSTTGKLVCGMSLSRWSRVQISAALQDSANVGGAYYRWRAGSDSDPDAYLTHLIEGSHSREQRDAWVDEQVARAREAGVDSRYTPRDTRRTKSTLVNTSGGKRIYQGGSSRSQREVWRTTDQGHGLDHKLALALLLYVSRNGEVTGSQLRKCGVILSRWVLTYAAALVEAGLLTRTREKRLCPNGRRQPCDVYRVAEVIPHLVDAADEKLWAAIRPDTPAHTQELSLDMFLGELG